MSATVLDAVLWIAGAGAFLAAYLAFSPVTRDLVVFLSRSQQIAIFRYRWGFWVVGAICLGWLLLRGLAGLGEGDGGIVGTAGTGWLVFTIVTVAGLALLYWATYVPVVMAPPREHRLVSAEEADRLLEPDSVVLGLVAGDAVRAYPRDLIARPHWFNDEIDGRPLMISYCILCNSGQAFVPEVDGRRLDLRNMTAFDNNTVYHDTVSGNFIQQLDARVIEGPDEGARLESYPVVIATWREWKELHPDTEIYYAPPMTLRDRVVDTMLRTMIPIPKLAARDKPWHLMHEPIDDRLPAMAFVYGVECGGEACAYPLEALQAEPVVNDEVGGTPVVVLYDRRRDVGQAFSRRLDDRTLRFSPAGDDASDVVARDAETGSEWDVTGRARRGLLEGRTLATVPHWNRLFWFSWAAFKRGTRIHPAGPPLEAAAPRRAAI